MPFVKLGVRLCTAINNEFVVTEHVTDISNWYAVAAEHLANINDLLNTILCGDEFRTMCGRLDCSLFLAVPINQRLVRKV